MPRKVISEVDVGQRLEQRTLEIIESVNNRDLAQPVRKYASNEFVYRFTKSDGQVHEINAEDYVRLFSQCAMHFRPKETSYAKVLNSTVAVDVAMGYATVWITYSTPNMIQNPGKEKVSISHWRRQPGSVEGADWKWCKEELSASAVPAIA